MFMEVAKVTNPRVSFLLALVFKAFFLAITLLIVATLWSEKEEDLLSFRLVPVLLSFVAGVSNSTVSVSPVNAHPRCFCGRLSPVVY